MRRRLQHLAVFGALVAVLSGPFASAPAFAGDRQPTAPGVGPIVIGQAQPAPAPIVPGPVPVGPPSAAGSGAAQPATTADQPGQTDAGQADEATGPTPSWKVLPGGTMVMPVTFYSATLGQTTWYELILPPGYAESSQRYPVLYMLHGAMGGAGEWIEIGIDQAADSLWAQGAMEPFIIVLPEGGEMNYWLNHANGGPRYNDYLVGDVVDEIDSHYRTLPDAADRAIGGLSMGGDGALRIALTYPDRFGVAGAHSPTTRLRYEDRPGDFYGDFGYWQQNNSLWLIEHTDSAERLRIWIDDGEDDPWIYSARELHQALLDKDVDHEYYELPGGHEADYWEANQSDYLQFYAGAFAAGPLASDPQTPVSDTP